MLRAIVCYWLFIDGCFSFVGIVVVVVVVVVVVIVIVAIVIAVIVTLVGCWLVGWMLNSQPVTIIVCCNKSRGITIVDVIVSVTNNKQQE